MSGGLTAGHSVTPKCSNPQKDLNPVSFWETDLRDFNKFKSVKQKNTVVKEQF